MRTIAASFFPLEFHQCDEIEGSEFAAPADVGGVR
jgi:hypothetical protein